MGCNAANRPTGELQGDQYGRPKMLAGGMIGLDTSHEGAFAMIFMDIKNVALKPEHLLFFCFRWRYIPQGK